MGSLTLPETPARTGSFRPILGAAVLLFVAVLATAGVKSYRDLEAARRHKDLLESRIQGTETEIARLRGKIERLRSDPGTLERLAREDLGMVRPGDVVIELPPDSVPLVPKVAPKEAPQLAPAPTPTPPAAPSATPVTAVNPAAAPAPAPATVPAVLPATPPAPPPGHP
jgi:cell division protein FtsB